MSTVVNSIHEINTQPFLMSKIRSLYSSSINCLADIDSQTDIFINSSSKKVIEALNQYQNLNSSILVRAETLKDNEKNLAMKYSDLEKQFELLSININSINSDLHSISELRKKIPKDLEALNAIIGMETKFSKELSEREKQLVNNLNATHNYLSNLVSYYKDISQLNCKKTSNTELTLYFSNVCQKDPKLTVTITLDISANSIKVSSVTPSDFNISQYIKYIDEHEDITVFLIYCVNEAIRLYNKDI